MKTVVTVLAVSFALFGFSHAAEREEEHKVGKVTCRVLGRSGRMMFRYPGKTNLIIHFDELKELDENNQVVGRSQKMKHSFNNFASQEFNFSQIVNKEYNGFKTKTFNFSGTVIGTGATMNVQVFFFLEGGEFVNGDESMTVSNGTVKFNIEITDWEFCNGTSNCRAGEFGDRLVFVLSVTSRIKPKIRNDRPPPKTPMKRRPKEFDMGEEVTFSLSGEVEIDGKLVKMRGDYPKYEDKNNTNFFSFRFPKFKKRVFYDPGLEWAEEEDSGAASVVGTSFSVFLVGFLIAILTVFE